MTWAWYNFAGGETRDLLLEGQGGVYNASIITSPVKTGVGALQIASGETGGRVVLGENLTAAQHFARLAAFQLQINFDGATLTNPIYLIGPNPSYSATGFMLEVGTDRRVRIVTTSEVPLTPWSVGTLGNGSYTHLVWVIDPLTLGSNHVWMTVTIDGVTQIAQDVGAWVNAQNFNYQLSTLGAAGFYVDAGVNIRLDDVCGGISTSAADAPHLTAMPVALVDAQHPATDTDASLTWYRVPDSGTWWEKWADATGNDGDTTYLCQNAVSTQSSGMESLATLGWAVGAVILENGTGVGPLWSVVHKTIDNKGGVVTYCSLAAAANVPRPPNTYIGYSGRLTRNGGTSWARADVDGLFAGVTIATTVSTMYYTTSLMLQWLYSEASLALTPAPMIPQGTMF